MVKTRDMLIDVARQLFAKQGVENTTMNDIALSSQRGRRTLYTYFNSKNDVYWAVVGAELDTIVEKLRIIVNKDMPSEEKLISYCYTRLDAVKEAVLRNGTLKAEFFRDIWKVEHVRKSTDMHTCEMIEEILQEGVENGAFQMPNIHATALVIHYALKGIEVPYVRDNFSELGIERLKLREYILDFILYGIKK